MEEKKLGDPIFLNNYKILIDENNKVIGKTYLPVENKNLKYQIIQIDDLRGTPYHFDEDLSNLINLGIVKGNDDIFLLSELPEDIRSEIKKDLIIYRLGKEEVVKTLHMNVQKNRVGHNRNGKGYDLNSIIDFKGYHKTSYELEHPVVKPSPAFWLSQEESKK